MPISVGKMSKTPRIRASTARRTVAAKAAPVRTEALFGFVTAVPPIFSKASILTAVRASVFGRRPHTEFLRKARRGTGSAPDRQSCGHIFIFHSITHISLTFKRYTPYETNFGSNEAPDPKAEEFFFGGESFQKRHKFGVRNGVAGDSMNLRMRKTAGIPREKRREIPRDRTHRGRKKERQR